jgi:malate dehydrogenase (oxaloacetate-decarboxylating)
MQQEGLTEAEARQRIYSFNRYGLLVEGCQGIRPGQEGLIRKREDIAGWSLTGSDPCAISLLDVARNAKITVLVGVSAQPGVFTEEIVREMASHTPRPVIFPLSNPTSKAEAVPADLLRWTDGRALVGTGSPFAPVEVDGKLVRISQINNSYIFPGLALGILVSKAARVTDNMIMTAARTLASLSPTRTDKNAPLLPPIGESRKVGLIVGEAVARQAIADGVASFDDPETLKEQLLAYVWKADYLPYERVL